MNPLDHRTVPDGWQRMDPDGNLNHLIGDHFRGFVLDEAVHATAMSLADQTRRNLGVGALDQIDAAREEASMLHRAIATDPRLLTAIGRDPTQDPSVYVNFDTDIGRRMTMIGFLVFLQSVVCPHASDPQPLLGLPAFRAIGCTDCMRIIVDGQVQPVADDTVCDWCLGENPSNVFQFLELNSGPVINAGDACPPCSAIFGR